MLDEVKSVRIGRAASREEWLEARDELGRILSTAVKEIRRVGGSEQAAERLMLKARMAVAALDYVAKHAADECRFIELPEDM